MTIPDVSYQIHFIKPNKIAQTSLLSQLIKRLFSGPSKLVSDADVCKSIWRWFRSSCAYSWYWCDADRCTSSWLNFLHPPFFVFLLMRRYYVSPFGTTSLMLSSPSLILSTILYRLEMSIGGKRCNRWCLGYFGSWSRYREDSCWIWFCSWWLAGTWWTWCQTSINVNMINSSSQVAIIMVFLTVADGRVYFSNAEYGISTSIVFEKW